MRSRLPWIILLLIIGIVVAVSLLKHPACGTGYHLVNGICTRR